MTGAQLQRLRARLKLTQAKLAEQLGVHWNTLARWERGEVPIRPPIARLLRTLEAGRAQSAAKARPARTVPRPRGKRRATDRGSRQKGRGRSRAKQQAARTAPARIAEPGDDDYIDEEVERLLSLPLDDPEHPFNVLTPERLAEIDAQVDAWAAEDAAAEQVIWNELAKVIVAGEGEMQDDEERPRARAARPHRGPRARTKKKTKT
jgi:transcriptional regulator with XRE-family HTH domain